jgi:hypothetical protein
MKTMPRRKRQSWLPDNVTQYSDRHGKKRYRFRKTGVPDYHFKSEPGTDEFLAELRQAEQAGFRENSKAPGSMDDLAYRTMTAPKFRAMAANSQNTYRGLMHRYLDTTDSKGRRFGSYPAKLATITGLEKQLQIWADRPGTGNNIRKALVRMFDHAKRLKWVDGNPAADTDKLRTKNKDGWHTWTDEEIDRYRAYWPLGTMARLTLELALDTAARRCNLATLERENLVEGRWEIEHAKDNEATSVRVSAEAKAAIDALPAAPIRYFITSAHGKPYTIESLGNRFNKWAKEAGCPTNIHGLRKARSRILAERGATTMEGRAITGHKKDSTFEHYAAKADRKRMADRATSLGNGEPRLANPKD